MHITDTSSIKDAINIVSFVGQYVKLRNGYGLCPFHTEKSPSFHVSDKFYKCFGCGASGDVIKFYMEIEGVSFKDAIDHLSQYSGVTRIKVKAPSEARILAEEASAWWNLRRQALVGLRNHLWDIGQDSDRVEAIYEAHASASREAVIETYRRVRTPWLGEQMRRIHSDQAELLKNIKDCL